jgi:hypothetical protein
MIPCYYCGTIYPSSEFGEWVTKRLTEIYDGYPPAGVCLNEGDRFNDIFHFIMKQEAEAHDNVLYFINSPL